jgi:starch-binding outer membrane protein, SusD/RagB family
MIRKVFMMIMFLAVVTMSCTKLNQKFEGQLTASQGQSGGSNSAAALLTGLYNSMQTPFQDQTRTYALWEMTTDELIGPTRGPDWDDNGVWRVLHAQKYDGENLRIVEEFKDLSGIDFGATDILRFNPTPQQAAEARMVRALADMLILDGFGQVTYRDPGESVVQPSRVRSNKEALDFIISELNAILPNLPNGPATVANKNAARALLMKCYLNKGVWQSNESRLNPTFAAADMNQVISLADAIINSGQFSFTSSYFDNFAPSNGTIGKENIFTAENKGGVQAGNIRSRWHSTMHYNQNPGGWNGFATLSDFYNKFEANDKRKGENYPTPSSPPNPGNRITVGFLVGQQHDLTTDANLKDRTGAPLIFTPQVKAVEVGTNLEVTGIRAYKYPIDFVNDGGGNVDNDYVYFRLADVLLMKAEAILRGGTGTTAGPYGSTALALVNYIRTLSSRGATPLASVNLDQLLDERGRELYLESWRRQDLIRFGKFLAPFQEKNYQSDNKYILFPIPNRYLAVNPNLKQNPGY